MITKITALYCRVSTDIQREKESIATQKSYLIDYAKGNNFKFQIYEDNGYSAKDTNRPALKKLISDIKDNKIERIVITKVDRITRRIKDLLDLLELFEQYKVAFKTLTQPIDTSSAMGRGFLNLLGVFGEMEREMTSERVSESMKVLTKKGKWLGGVLPYGYTSKNKQLIINNQEALILKKIYKKYIELESLRGVTQWLNTNGIKTRNKKTWACASISRILQNPTYIGKLSWGKRVSSTTTGKLKSKPKEEWIISEGRHKPIIDNFTFNKVQEIIKKQYVEPRRKLSEYLLSSLVRCGFCNGSMNGYSQRRYNKIYAYYKCHNAMSKGKSVCKGNAINKDLLEKIVIDKILSSIDKSKIDIKKALDIYNREIRDKISPLKSEKETLEKRSEGIELKKKTLLEKLEDRIIDNQTYKNRINELEEELTKNRDRIFKIDIELNDKNVESISFELVYEKIRDFKKAWHTLDYTAKKELLYTLISNIIVKGEQIDINLFFLPSLFSSNLRSHTGRGSLRRPG